ncbi:MAG: DUF58 domain-containing protein [Clostridia bacterium]|nr:DUF58 domain-containing protein [Clostridia bacterium]
MIRRWGWWAAWTVAAAVLYFFENNLGTRVILCWSLLVPVLLRLMKAYAAGKDRAGRKPRSAETAAEKPGRGICPVETGEPDVIRDYVPGDSIRRIHWKLSAKTDRLLIREDSLSPENSDTETPVETTVRQPRKENGWRAKLLIGLIAAFLLSLILLFALPEARNGTAVLLNRLFACSEAVNAYRYARFAVPDGQGTAPAVGLLVTGAAVLAALLLITKNRPAACLTASAMALVQTYFGLSLPFWANIPLLCALAAFLLPRPVSRRSLLICGALLLGLALLFGLVWPGVDSATEEASERVRDLLGTRSGQSGGTESELPDAVMETRHANTQSLLRGEQEAHTGRTYRLVTVEERQISMPKWIDWLRIIALLLLAVAVLILPFLPFAYLNIRRRRALSERERFRSEDRAEAICAMFRHVGRWFEATGNGGGNLLYRDWPEILSKTMPEDYVTEYRACAALFEEAAYSDHPMTEAQRERVRSLLDETEAMLYGRADWKRRLRLRYVDWLWTGGEG